MWVNGPFAPGTNPEIDILRTDMRSALPPEEYVIADMGYLDDQCLLPCAPSVPPALQTLIRARNETVNELFRKNSRPRL